MKVFDGVNGAIIHSFFAYPPNFTGGVSVAAGDVNGDGWTDIITGAGAGAPGGHVKAFDGQTGAEIRSFFAYPGFTGGVRVAAGDVNADGRDDIITGAGPGGGPHVRVFNGLTGARLTSFLAFPGSSGGVFVAAGDVNGDGRADIVTGQDTGGDPHVKLVDGRSYSELDSFFAYDAGFVGGVRVAVGDVNDDGTPDLVPGPGAGTAPHVKVFAGHSQAELGSFFAYGSELTGGVFVAAAPQTRQLVLLPPGLGPITVRKETADVVVVDGEGTELLRRNAEQEAIPFFAGSNGDDELVIHFDGGDPFPRGGQFQGAAGHDVVRLTGDGGHLDLTRSRPVRLTEIETIDLTGAGPQQLTLTAQEVTEMVADGGGTLAIHLADDDTLLLDAGWKRVAQASDGAEFVHAFLRGGASVSITNAAPWQNPTEPCDVDGDGFVVPRDALVIINTLNADGSRFLLPPATSALPVFYYDVTGKDPRLGHSVEPRDALLVINRLNATVPLAGGEGESRDGRSAIGETSTFVPSRYAELDQRTLLRPPTRLSADDAPPAQPASAPSPADPVDGTANRASAGEETPAERRPMPDSRRSGVEGEPRESSGIEQLESVLDLIAADVLGDDR